MFEMLVGEAEVSLSRLEMLVDDVEMEVTNTEMIAAEAEITATQSVMSAGISKQECHNVQCFITFIPNTVI